ncbi:MAG: hypothetical protein HYV14_14215 [Elusimicrobia bacterium]|nr:hypothetical protein [Elusimicrobiota bacterium]
MTGRRETLAAALLLACAAAALAARARAVAQAPRDEYCRAESDFHVERGEALLHGVPVRGVARAMPAYSAPNAFLCGHMTASAAAAVRSAAVAAGAVLVFALGATLYSGVSGAAAALLYALMPAPHAGGERWLYVPAVLLAACFLARRAQAPSRAATLWTAAALGTGFLILSPLSLFPLALALYEWARGRREGVSRPGDAAALVLVPFVFLIPWIVMNWRLAGRLVVFEDGRADDNVITGALGLVRTMGVVDSRKLAELSADRSVLAWAAAEILSHPLRFLSSAAQRAAYAASLKPLLVLAAAASAWLWRGRDDRRQVALLAAYFLAVHCLMPVEANYFVPWWPLLAVLASGLLAARTSPASARLTAAAAAAAFAVLAPLLGVAAWAQGLALAYPARAREERALEREIARHPRDAWLLSERGLRLLRDGRPDLAVGDLTRAFALDPRRDRELDRAWALLAGGGPAARILEAPGPRGFAVMADLRESVLRAAVLALRGRGPEAAAVLEAAGRRGDAAPGVVLEIVASWPETGRAALIERLAAVPGFLFAGKDLSPEAWLDLDAAAKNENQRRTALQLLAFAAESREPGEGAALGPEKTRRLALAYRDVGRYSRATALVKGAGPGGVWKADLLTDIAALAARAGREAEALEALAYVESLDPDPEKLRNVALVYRDMGRFSQATAVLTRAGPSGPREADVLTDMAARAARAGRKAEALDALARAESLNLDPERLRRLAVSYRDLGGYGRSLAVMKRTDMAGEKDVRLLLDNAARAAKQSRRAEALANLTFAGSRALPPEELRGLAHAYRDVGDYARALAVLKRLGARGSRDADGLLDLAVRAAKGGRRETARESLAFAEGTALDARRLRSLARAYRESGDFEGAARVSLRLGDAAASWLDRAEAACAAGDRAAAAAHLARVQGGSLGEGEARRLILLRQTLGDYDGALAAVGLRVRARPGDARWRSDRGVLHALMGRREEAIADWTAAIALDPDFLAPYLSLGSLYEASNRRGEATALYRAAVSRPRVKDGSETARRALTERLATPGD